MFGYKSFLKIGMLDDSSIIGLYRSSYELKNFTYSFQQGVDGNGKPQTNVRGGTINVTYGGTPPEDLLVWMLASGKREDGVLVICDEQDMPLEKIIFEEAVCIGMQIEYAQVGKSYLETKLTIQVRKMKVGDSELENPWVN